MKWIWIRHGQTNENKKKQYLGHFDAPLNEMGIDQAKLCAHKIMSYNIPQIFTSDLKRAHHTASFITKSNPIQTTPALRELNFGEWDCRTYDELIEINKEQVFQWYDNPFDRSPPNGETLNQMGDRVDQFLTAHLNEDMMIITHGGPIRWFLSKWVQNDRHQFWQVSGLQHGEALLAEFQQGVWKVQTL